MRYSEMDYFSKLLKKSDEYDFLAESHAHLIQQKLKDLDKAYKDATVSYSGGHWYISIQIEKEVSINEYREPKDIGIDLGISNFVSLSNGDQNPLKIALKQTRLN